jgi:hypothetical protein
MRNHQSRPTGSSSFSEVNAKSFPEANVTLLKEVVVEDVVAVPKEVVDMVVIMFGNVMMIGMLNQMIIIRRDMKKERIHYLLKNMKIIIIDVVCQTTGHAHVVLLNI